MQSPVKQLNWNHNPDKEIITMNEEITKLAKIKKSCRLGRILSVILCIVSISGCVLCLIGSITIFSMGDKFDSNIVLMIDKGMINADEDSYGSVRAVNINLGSADNIHSDIPALQEQIDRHPYAIKYSMTLMICALACAVAAILIKLIQNVFATIEKEYSPFTDKVIKKVAIVLGASTVVLFLTSGLAFGALGALTTWVVCTVMDYGKTLQTQSDETL